MASNKVNICLNDNRIHNKHMQVNDEEKKDSEHFFFFSLQFLIEELFKQKFNIWTIILDDDDDVSMTNYIAHVTLFIFFFSMYV